ncbi:MAG TPA: NAD-glutamate dehydrogenase domain-containing protein, partial [Ramlibacter sp.]|nr:NAD-glutamate dehydrogenase domain-containing protein [Ramlibacter sp.]
APVDLLYNGGIGTYVKASGETHAEVGDRANDGVRISGAQLRCKVVAEGGNLGFTQRGRIEAALAGVRLNTDAIDNSAGVDTSDHEVNIKILLGIVEADGELTTRQRNTLLPQMTDDVAALVLRDNYFQTQALSIAKRLAPQQLDEQARFIRFLEKKGELDRAIEFLPSDEEIAERKARGLGLVTPEQAVLLAYGKMWLNDELVASDLPEDPWIATALHRYFPRQLQEKFAGAIPRHPLKREIIVTHVLNSMVNRVGPTFVHRLGEITGATPPQVVRAYLAAREVFGLVPLWQGIEALDNRVPDEMQAAMVITLRALLGRATTWFLRSRRLFEPTQQQVGRFAPAVQALRAHAQQGAGESPRARGWIAAGVPAELAAQVDSADALFHALDIAEIAEATKRPLEFTAQVHAGVGERLGLPRMRQQIEALPTESFWQGLAKLALTDDLTDLQRSIAQEAISHPEAAAAAEVLDRWEAGNRQSLVRARRLLAELQDSSGSDLAMLSVALRELRNLA